MRCRSLLCRHQTCPPLPLPHASVRYTDDSLPSFGLRDFVYERLASKAYVQDCKPQTSTGTTIGIPATFPASNPVALTPSANSHSGYPLETIFDRTEETPLADSSPTTLVLLIPLSYLSLSPSMFTNFLITLYLFDFFPRLTDDLFRYSGSGSTKPVRSPAGDRTLATMTRTTPFMHLLARDMLPDQARGSASPLRQWPQTSLSYGIRLIGCAQPCGGPVVLFHGSSELLDSLLVDGPLRP